MRRKVLIYPAKILKEKTKEVKEINGKIVELIRDMYETMEEEEGVGLACNQIGVPLSIMVMDTTKRENSPSLRLTLINPKLVEGRGELLSKEGCLSFPGLSVEVKRFEEVFVKGINEEGKEVELELKGFPAVVFQHEYDHLNGITFIDRLEGIRRRIALERFRKLKVKGKKGRGDS